LITTVADSDSVGADLCDRAAMQKHIHAIKNAITVGEVSYGDLSVCTLPVLFVVNSLQHLGFDFVHGLTPLCVVRARSVIYRKVWRDGCLKC